MRRRDPDRRGDVEDRERFRNRARSSSRAASSQAGRAASESGAVVRPTAARSSSTRPSIANPAQASCSRSSTIRSSTNTSVCIEATWRTVCSGAACRIANRRSSGTSIAKLRAPASPAQFECSSPGGLKRTVCALHSMDFERKDSSNPPCSTQVSAARSFTCHGTCTRGVCHRSTTRSPRESAKCTNGFCGCACTMSSPSKGLADYGTRSQPAHRSFVCMHLASPRLRDAGTCACN